ncbi:zinc finger, CCHC-type containing protein [Tanacetum coccineum]
MDVKTTFLNGELEEEVYMIQPQGFIMPVNENKMCKLVKYLYRLKQTPKQWHQKFDEVLINNAEDNSSTSGWVFLLGGGAISWASKNQTCITGSIMESEFVALAAAGKEAEWLRNLILEIPLWSKPIAPKSIHCDSVATLAKDLA